MRWPRRASRSPCSTSPKPAHGGPRIIGKAGQPAPLVDFERVVRINLIGSYNVARLAAARIDPAEFASLALEIVRNGHLNGEVIRLDGALRMAPR